jgi:hypothetical protein
MYNETKNACGSQLAKFPTVGMTDKMFRECTTYARVNLASQVVVSDDGDGKIPLRLYVFNNTPRRVYSIDGVITAIQD